MRQLRLARNRRVAVFLWVTLAWTVVAPAQQVETTPDPRLLRIIEDMQKRLDTLEEANRELRRELDQLKGDTAAYPSLVETPSLPRALRQDNLIVSGTAGIGFFQSDSDGSTPNSEFRIDEARLFVDVLLFDQGYLFNELILAEREGNNSDMRIGEVYVELEELPWLSSGAHTVSLRAGRFDIPFGEEYLTRDAIDNPLISHSLADFWGIDEGIELFGRTDRLDYVVAVQNGGHPSLKDGDSDKALVGRLGVQASDSVRLSLSVLRTGDLDVEDDETSELWFGNGFIRSLGGEETTRTFEADLAEAGLCVEGSEGHFYASAGYLQYDDDDTAADNSRDAHFYTVEGVRTLSGRLYGGARFSAIHADDGMPVVGQGSFGSFFDDVLMEDIWRLSLGLGYRWTDQVVLKSEYSLEQGERTDGSDADNRDLFSVELALGF